MSTAVAEPIAAIEEEILFDLDDEHICELTLRFTGDCGRKAEHFCRFKCDQGHVANRWVCEQCYQFILTYPKKLSCVGFFGHQTYLDQVL